MPRGTLTVRVESKTRTALDSIAEALDRDRSYVVNEALENYIETHRWQIEHIRRGLDEANAGKFVDESKVRATIARLKRK